MVEMSKLFERSINFNNMVLITKYTSIFDYLDPKIYHLLVTLWDVSPKCINALLMAEFVSNH